MKYERAPHLPARIPNNFTEREAKRLASMIEKYWKTRGYAGIKTKIVEHIVPEELREEHERKTLYFVRSNIGPLGFPPRTAEQPSRAMAA